MRYLFLLSLVALGCDAPSIAAPPSKETIVEALERYHKLTDTKVDTLVETVGNNTAELEAVKEELKAIRELLSVPDVVPVPVPPAESPPVKADAPPKEQAGQRVTFHGSEINVAEWLATPLTEEQIVEVEIKKKPANRAAVEEHVRWHGIAGNLSGFDRGELIQLHSVAHLKDDKKKPVVMNAAVVLPQASGCFNGQCQRPMVQWTYGRRRR